MSAAAIQRLGGPTKVHRLYAPHRYMPITTIHGWQRRGRIPQRYWGELIVLGMKAGISISLGDFNPLFREGVVSNFPPLKGTGGGSIVRKFSELALNF